MVRHWSADGGFGFLNDGQSEYFCHGSQLKNCCSLEVGDKVTFTAAPSKKKAGKKEAKEVYSVDGQGAAARMMGRGGFGSSTAIKTRGRAEPSISSTVPIESQKDASKAAPPHRQAVGLSKGVPSQLRQTSKADQSIGQSTAASSSTARATASAAALSQHGSATLPKSLGEEKQSAESGSQPVLNHKEMQRKGKPTGKKDRAMQKKRMDLVIATTGLDDVAKVEEASHKIPRSEDLETMSATTRASLLETSESVRDSDTDSCQAEPIEEESFDSLAPQQAAGGDYYSPMPQPPMMTGMMQVPAAPGFGRVAHQHPWALPALPVFYVDPRGGVHPLQQMMVPVAVPISSTNCPPAGAALPPRL